MMNKSKRFRELRNKAKRKFNLDKVSILHTVKQHQKEGLEFKKHRVFFKMTYEMKNPPNIVVFCPISYLVIDEKEDALILKTLGEVLMGNQEIQKMVNFLHQNGLSREFNESTDG